MKTQDAIDFIKKSLLDGSAETEITATLMAEDSIGRSKPTAEIIAGLFERATEPEELPTNDAPADDAPTSPKGNVYEKWKVGIARNGKIVNKIAKLRTVSISDALADMLNSAGTTGNGFSIRYIKK